MAPAMLGGELVQQVSQGKDPKERTPDPSPGLQSHDHFMTQPCFSGGGSFYEPVILLNFFNIFKKF